MPSNIVRVCAALVALLCSGIAIAGAIIRVDQKGLAFTVSSLTLKKGDVVNFTNSDKTSHNILIVGEGVKLNSGLQAPGVPFRAPFLKAGSYRVMCGIHPRMKMTVTVK